MSLGFFLYNAKEITLGNSSQMGKITHHEWLLMGRELFVCNKGGVYKIPILSCFIEWCHGGCQINANYIDIGI